jgi:hypothetical protein
MTEIPIFKNISQTDVIASEIINHDHTIDSLILFAAKHQDKL